MTCTPQGYRTPAAIYVPDDYSTIQAAIEAVHSGRTIIVRDGIYTGTGNKDLRFFGKAMTLRSENGPGSTIIDCENSGRGFAFQSGESRSTVVIGLTVRNGSVNTGGGILINNASPMITDCLITTNKVVGGAGGGIAIGGGSPLVSGCTISNNAAWGSDGTGPEGSKAGNGLGGGICCTSSSAVIRNCRISGNTAKGGNFIRYAEGNGGDGFGGGIYGSPAVINCEIAGNKAIYGSSAAYHPINNYGRGNGAGVYGSAEIVNCTISYNRVTDFFGGQVAGVRGGTLANSIVWGNLDGGQVADAAVAHSDIEGGYAGMGNISEDPRFAQETNDYRLLLESPCIDAGDNADAGGGDDLDRNPRIISRYGGTAAVDMGAHEYQPPSAIREGFAGFQTGTRPAGWTFENCNADSDTFTSPGFYGAALPSLALDGDGDRVVSRPFACSRSEALYLWIRGAGTGEDASLLVEEFYSSAWNGITEISNLSVFGTVAGAFTLNTDSSQVRFSFSGSAGALAFDDVCITQPSPSPSPEGYLTPTPSPSATPSPQPSAVPSPAATPSPEPSLTPARTPAPSPAPTCRPSLPPGPAVVAGGDYNGDGTADVSVFRPPSGKWYVRSLTWRRFGLAGDLPASGDYDGDGTTEMSLFRPSSGQWFIYSLTRVYYGTNGDMPVPGDFNGDGSLDITVFRGLNGCWYIRDLTRRYYGTNGDWPLPDDYSGDGTQDLAVFRSGGSLWAVLDRTRFCFGASSDWPITLDMDGDDSSDLGIFRPCSGMWAIRNLSRFFMGSCTDWPRPADFNGDGVREPGIFRDSSGLWMVIDLTRLFFGSTGDIPVTR